MVECFAKAEKCCSQDPSAWPISKHHNELEVSSFPLIQFPAQTAPDFVALQSLIGERKWAKGMECIDSSFDNTKA